MTGRQPHDLVFGQYERAEVRVDRFRLDPNVFTRPWRISMPLYRRLEPNMQMLEYRCIEFAEEFLYGHLRKEPLVTPYCPRTRSTPSDGLILRWTLAGSRRS